MRISILWTWFLSCLGLGLLGIVVLGSMGHSAAISHLGTNQKVLVICVKWNDIPTTRLATCNDWVTLLNNETNSFYSQATFGQTTFLFQLPTGGPANGWYSLGYDSSGYGFFKTGQDAINLADPNVDFTQYHRVVVITNHTGFGGQGGGPFWWKTNEGVEAVINGVGVRLMTMAVVNEWQAHSFGNPFDEAASVVAHELGHQLALPTHYGDLRWHPGLGRDVITPWDVMGLSPTLNHFLGWAKNHRSWIPMGPRVQTVGPPSGSNIDTTINLEPQESTQPGVQLIKIPFTPAGPFVGYIVENRRKINGDQFLPSDGVLLSLLDESPNIILPLFVLEDPGSPGNLNLAPLEVGDSFTDPARNLTVGVTRQTGDNFRVRVQYGLPASAKPDPMITPWGAPPWESVDIWIDSEKNGWGAYKYTDAAGNPTGNGDDAWVKHVNRVYVRVRNVGPGIATNVRVQVYSNEPPGMGDAGASWAYLGTITFPSIAPGATVQEFVNWTPTVGAHTCVKAAIQNLPGELSTSNNLAQENVAAFDTSSSAYKPVGLQIRVNNPFEREKTPVRFHVRDIPPGWAVLVEPLELTLPAGGSDSVLFLVFPSGSPQAEVPAYLQVQLKEYRPGFIGKPKIEALVPYADTFIPIGGVEVWTHLVEHTTLTCAIEHFTRTEEPVIARPKQPTKEKQVPVTFPRGATVLPPAPIPAYAAGRRVTVTGQLTPPKGGTVVAVEFSTGQKRVVQLTKTDERGKYRVEYVPRATGVWKVQVFYSGDQTHGEAESILCHFRVVGKER